jgi:hypothetical protein
MTTITDTQQAQLAEAFSSPALRLSRGLGTRGSIDSGERCTIAEIQLVLTGVLSDGPHPCISEMIRRWVIPIQDAMPDEIRNSPAWRAAAPLIAGTATDDERIESERRDLIIAWMWDRLADEPVLAALPDEVRPAWDRMLAKRTYDDAAAAARAAARAATDAARATARAADAAYYADAGDAYAAAAADDATRAATYAAYAANAAANGASTTGASTTGDRQAYWRRADPADLLARLVAIR